MVKKPRNLTTPVDLGVDVKKTIVQRGEMKKKITKGMGKMIIKKYHKKEVNEERNFFAFIRIL